MMKAQPNVQASLSPERRTHQRRVGNSRDAHIAGRACFSKQLEEVENAAVARAGEPWVGRREAIAREKIRADLDGVALRACRGVLDLRAISKLHGYCVPKDIAKAPIAVTGRVEQRILAAAQEPDDIAIRSLGEIEDADGFRPARWLLCCGQRILTPQQVIHEEAPLSADAVHHNFLPESAIRGSCEDADRGERRRHPLRGRPRHIHDELSAT